MKSVQINNFPHHMNIITLLCGTILIVLFSWFLSIKHRRYHGIARFFSFESIFLLILLNYSVWFKDPISPTQIISWILLCSSIYPGVVGFALLKDVGKPQGGNFENTSVLVKKGIYGYIRHPLYFSLLLLGTGIMMKKPETWQLVLGSINLLAIYLTARIEEYEMIARFGDEYRVYMTETKMFLPYLL
jgi:protein-S-isoprenylcysteine O-methyltransferase Ste14